jgi:hypothetical protein
VVGHECGAELLHDVCAEGLQQGSSLKHGCSLWEREDEVKRGEEEAIQSCKQGSLL